MTNKQIISKYVGKRNLFSVFKEIFDIGRRTKVHKNTFLSQTYEKCCWRRVRLAEERSYSMKYSYLKYASDCVEHARKNNLDFFIESFADDKDEMRVLELNDSVIGNDFRLKKALKNRIDDLNIQIEICHGQISSLKNTKNTSIEDDQNTAEPQLLPQKIDPWKLFFKIVMSDDFEKSNYKLSKRKILLKYSKTSYQYGWTKNDLDKLCTYAKLYIRMCLKRRRLIHFYKKYTDSTIFESFDHDDNIIASKKNVQFNILSDLAQEKENNGKSNTKSVSYLYNTKFKDNVFSPQGEKKLVYNYKELVEMYNKTFHLD